MPHENRSIDVHTHVYLPSYVEMLRSRRDLPRVLSNPDRLVILPGEESERSTASGRPLGEEFWNIERKIDFMDTHGIATSIISTANPWLDFLTDPDEAVFWSRRLNDDLQQTCASSTRLLGFGVLPTGCNDWEACAQELDRLAEMSHMRGVIIGTSDLDDPAKDALWSAAERNGQFVFVHPHYGVGNEVLGTDYGHALLLALGFPFDTSAAIARLILSGVMERFPKLKVLVAHAGGTLPYLAGRLDSCVMHDQHMAKRLPRKPSEYLKMLYYDAIAYQETTLRAVGEFAGWDRLFYGTDHPFFSPLEGKDNPHQYWSSVGINEAAIDTLAPEQQRQIRFENAARLFNA